MNGLCILFQDLLDPGDKVILPDLMWTEIDEDIRLAGGIPVPIRLHPEVAGLFPGILCLAQK